MEDQRRTTQVGSRESARLGQQLVAIACGWPRTIEAIICVTLAAATVAAYKNASDNGFVDFDDPQYVTQNAWVQMGLSRASVYWAFTTFDAANWHPLTWLSLELDCELFGLEPAYFHATNVALHVANTLVLYVLLRRWTGAVGRSACAAAFFALHPLHVESVAWISERKDLFSTLFVLLSLLAWGVYARRARLWAYVAALLLFSLSLMAKPMAVSLPILLLLFDIWPFGRRDDTAIGSGGAPTIAWLVAEKIPFLVMSGASTAITFFAQNAGGALAYGKSLSPAVRLWAVPINYLTYLRQTFWPAGLIAFYRHPGTRPPAWKSLTSLAILALITIVLLRLRKITSSLMVGWFWFLISLLPVIGIVQVGAHTTADRYMYLPMIGLLITICWGAWALGGLWKCQGWLAVCAIGLLIVCAGLTFRQVAMWHDTATLFAPLTARDSPW